MKSLRSCSLAGKGSRTRWFTVFLCFSNAVLCSAGFASDICLIKDETRIPPGETRSFEFGQVPQNDATVLIEVTSRLDWKTLSGSSYFLRMTLNGNLVNAAKTRSVSRLMNKPLVSPVAPGMPYAWFGGGVWRVLYAPDFEGALKRTYYTGNPYELVLDATDLASPTDKNRLEIANLAKRDISPSGGPSGDLLLRNLIIRIRPGASPTMTAGGIDGDVINRGTPGAGPAKYTGELLPGGGFGITIGDKHFEFASAVSYPNAGLNKLTPSNKPDSRGQDKWRVSAGGTGVIAEGPDYRVRRAVRFTARRVEIEDEITNKHRDEKLGLLVRHQVALNGRDFTVRLAGNPDPGVSEYYSNGNPTVYVALANANLGLGLIAEDDVFRNQATLFYDPDTLTAGLRTEMLCLPPGGAYTLHWSVYPVASCDYYDFINLVRDDWGANYTVEGPWTFFDPDGVLAAPLDVLREQFKRLGIRYACSWGGWVDPKHDPKRIGFGAGVMDANWADYRGRLREAARKIRQAAPGCRVLVYYDSQRDTSAGGHHRFSDSCLTGPRGNQLSTDWNGLYSLTWSVVATLRNSFGQAMLGVADQYLEQVGADGLYWDEMEAVGFGAPLLTHNIADGHSCLLDKGTYTVDHEIGLTSLLGADHRAAVIDRIRAKGGTLLGNGPIATRKLLAMNAQRMVEIQHNDTWSYEGNLGTPLGYASSRMDFGNWTRALRLATLLVGTRYTYTHAISPHVFPFTPIELHSGYLLGKERIITIHSGNYGWPEQRCLVQSWHFDKMGKLTAAEVVTTLGNEARTLVSLRDGEAMVLERIPVDVQPAAGVAEITRVRYGSTGLGLSVRAPSGATFSVNNGVMKIAPHERFALAFAGTSATEVASDHAVLVFNVSTTQARSLSLSPLP